MPVPLKVAGGPRLEECPEQLEHLRQILDKPSHLLEFIESGRFGDLDCIHLLSVMSTSLQKGSNCDLVCHGRDW